MTGSAALALVPDVPDQPTDDVLVDVEGVRGMFPAKPTRWWR